MNIRAGVPYIARGVGTSTAAYIDFLGISQWLRIVSDAALRIYFTQADVQSGTHYVAIAPGVIWEGPARAGGVYVVAPAGSPNYEICAFTGG